jgi:hypothetical protein
MGVSSTRSAVLSCGAGKAGKPSGRITMAMVVGVVIFAVLVGLLSGILEDGDVVCPREP